MQLRLAVGRNIRRGIALATTAQFAVAYLGLLSPFVVVQHFVVCVVCAVVMFASRVMYDCFLFKMTEQCSGCPKIIQKYNIGMCPVRMALASFPKPALSTFFLCRPCQMFSERILNMHSTVLDGLDAGSK